MLTTNEIENKDRLEIIEEYGLPIAAKSTTYVTSINSTFLPVNVLIFLRRGSIKIYSDQDSFHAKPGDYFFLSSYANYKAQRLLDPSTNDFESITFFIDHMAFIHESATIDFADFKKITPLCKLTSDEVDEVFNILEHHFRTKTKLSDIDLKLLSRRVELIKESITDETHISISDGENDDFLSFLYNHITINITLDALALSYGMSTSSFHRLFVKRLGVPPHMWIKDLRLQYARCWMLFSQKPVSEIYLELGFQDLSHFSREFKKKFGYSPSKTTTTTTIEVIK